MDGIRHIVDEKKLSREDVIDYLDRFADTILEFDRVTFDYYTDSRGKKTSGLLFRKRFEDSTIISFDLVSNNKRSILLQSLYMENADYQRKKRSAETPLMPNTSAHTPEARVGQTSDTSIPDSSEKINPSAKNSSRRNALPDGFEYTEYDKPITAEDIATLRSFGRHSINELASNPDFLPATQKWAHKFYRELGTKSPFFRAWFGDWRAHQIDGAAEFFIDAPVISSRAEGDAYVRDGIKNKSLYRGDVVNSDTKFTINIGAQVYNDSLTYANREYSRGKNLDLYKAEITILSMLENIVRDSVLLDTRIVDADENVQDRSFMHYFYSVATVDGKSYLVKLSVDELESRRGTIRRAYNVDDIQISPVAVTQVYKPAVTTGDMEGNTPLTHSISDLFALVKQYDKEFSPNPVSEHVLNEDGTPKVFYHGTSNEFYAFEKGHKRTRGRLNFGNGFYFAPKRSMAEMYAEGERAKVLESYVALRNPYLIYGTIFDQSDFDAIGADVTSENVAEKLQALGYDGIIARSYNGKDNPVGTVVAFDPTQIKSASTGVDANIGTFDSTNPDIRMALPDGFDPSDIVDRGLPTGGKPLTVGQVNRLRANIFRYKAFSRR